MRNGRSELNKDVWSCAMGDGDLSSRDDGELL
jgi:hypothetical protein